MFILQLVTVYGIQSVYGPFKSIEEAELYRAKLVGKLEDLKTDDYYTIIHEVQTPL